MCSEGTACANAIGVVAGQPPAGSGCSVVDSFWMAQETGVCRRIRGLPPFITVRGGAYFFPQFQRAALSGRAWLERPIDSNSSGSGAQAECCTQTPVLLLDAPTAQWGST